MRIQAEQHFDAEQALRELDKLKFAVSAMADRYPLGSYEGEQAHNAVLGIKYRIDFLHDSLSLLLKPLMAR